MNPATKRLIKAVNEMCTGAIKLEELSQAASDCEEEERLFKTGDWVKEVISGLEGIHTSYPTRFSVFLSCKLHRDTLIKALDNWYTTNVQDWPL